ncbi:MAG: phosphatidate cytidylyltransferase, partial [Planctomycetota bacterium]
KIGDIAGYFVGSAIGKHHPFKRLSPGKTTEGCLGSLVAGGLAGALLGAVGWLPEGRGVAAGLGIGLVLNLAAQAGDLLESYIKRTAGVKDSSGWMGASGGVLDVTDSLLLTVPAALVVWGLPIG